MMRVRDIREELAAQTRRARFNVHSVRWLPAITRNVPEIETVGARVATLRRDGGPMAEPLRRAARLEYSRLQIRDALR